jgi:hypothetical protein
MSRLLSDEAIDIGVKSSGIEEGDGGYDGMNLYQ